MRIRTANHNRRRKAQRLSKIHKLIASRFRGRGRLLPTGNLPSAVGARLWAPIEVLRNGVTLSWASSTPEQIYEDLRKVFDEIEWRPALDPRPHAHTVSEDEWARLVKDFPPDPNPQPPVYPTSHIPWGVQIYRKD